MKMLQILKIFMQNIKILIDVIKNNSLVKKSA